MSPVRIIEGYLFDVYHIEDEIHLWVLDTAGRCVHCQDQFQPRIYISGEAAVARRFVARLIELDALAEAPRVVTKKHFYTNQPLALLDLKICKPSLLRKIKATLYHFYNRLDVYHADIELPTAYMNYHQIFPMGRVRITAYPSTTLPGLLRVQHIERLDRLRSPGWSLPAFRILEVFLTHPLRLGLSAANPLYLRFQQTTLQLHPDQPLPFLQTLNRILLEFDPDILLTTGGDQVILPALLEMSRRVDVPLALDRDQRPGHTRRIQGHGTSYNTYGSWIYVAPSFPLFGRWHLDRRNSFVYKEASLDGIIELARLSRLPVQRLARSSTGAALTAIEVDVALRQDYLVPWQKSAVEGPRTARQLLTADKGGLVFIPDIRKGNAFEQIAQIDFHQMYPAIMVRHNISPETVNCSCCRNDPHAGQVPEIGYHICHRRQGIVSMALRHILRRRAYYKEKIKRNPPGNTGLQSRQVSLKWMLVTAFGYLGYRNAKFGRIESHESVTAFGREKLLQAKELAEDAGYRVVHAITDCLFIYKEASTTSARMQSEPLDPTSLAHLCRSISKLTGIRMDLDAAFDWLVFVSARQDAQLAVTNRYFGRLADGSLKLRGIASRRRDTPAFIKQAQLQLLELLREADSLTAIALRHARIHQLYLGLESKIEQDQVPWRQLLVERKSSRQLTEYQVASATALGMAQLATSAHIQVQPGEKLRFVVLHQKHPDPRRRYATEEYLTIRNAPDTIVVDRPYYRRMLWEAYREIYYHLCPPGYQKAFFQRPMDDQLLLFDP
ncbi:MAG: DNA polymerase [Leptospiraceae bacterium]|nr:DNA polymerase [Leptospiraceae bacterium]